MEIDLTVPNMAYIFGFFQTDGHLSENTRNRGRLSLELNAEDRHILEDISKALHVRTTLKDRTRDTNFKDGYESTVLKLFDWDTREQLKALGLPVGKKSAIVTPPSVAFSERDYFRGLIDGDGSLGFTRTELPFVSFCTKSPSLCKALLDCIFKVTGQRKIVNPNARDKMYNITLFRESAQVFANYLYEGAELALNRKRAAAANIQRWVRPNDMPKVEFQRRFWTKEEDDIVLSFSIEEAAKSLNRTVKSVTIRKHRLKHGTATCRFTSGTTITPG